MATLSLKVSVVEKNVVKTMQFDPSTIIYDACKIIREKISEANLGNPKDYGLFLADEDPKKGVWLELGRNLEYYLLRSGDLLEYKKKTRTLRIRMLDGTVKTMMVDDSLPAGQLMVIICTRLGITNYEEYSLVKDMPEDEKELMGTLKKDKTLMRDQKKMEQMKRKLHTDDELNWIDQSKTLREQGVDENETLLLRRKFFYSDQNIDSRDPVQLNLLYVQSRDAIINGTHPVTLDEACQFGGIQCQIQFGDNNEAKHKAGFLDLKEFLPKDYVKVKGVEKRIFTEHRNYVGFTELDSKVKYTQLARSLKTYGVTFFLVKEKMKGKNKLVPRLLGVTKESVLRLDEKTKEILKVWPLTTVRRWAASPNSFTLDFGDYSDSYYSVQTTEGEQISQLIAGYIDIILKKKKAKDHFGIEGDEGSTLVEDEVSPAKATILQHQTNKITHPNEGHIAIPAVMREVNGAVTFSTGSMDRAQYGSLKGQAHSAYVSPMHHQRKTAEMFSISSRGQQEAHRENFSQSISSPSSQPKVSDVMSKSQKALIGTIDSGKDTVKRVEIELQTKAQIPQLGSDPTSKKWKEDTVDLNKQTIVSQLAAINAGTAQVITLTSGSPEEVDPTAVGAAIGTISSNLGEMSRGVTMLAALMEDAEDGERLLEAARKLCIAFSDLLRAVEPDTKVPRQELLSAASKIGEASKAMIQTIGEEDEYDKDFEDALLGLAKAVANATAALVLKAKNVASTCDDQGLQNKVISSATQCALATSQLVACAKVVSPTITSPACQEQLFEAAKEVAKAVEGVVGAAQSACKDEQLLREVGAAATQVTQALNDLLQHVKHGKEKAKVTPHDADVDTILTATDNLFKSMGDASEMVKQAKILAQTTSHLVSSIKGEAEGLPDSDMQKRLLAAAKNLADATARLVEAAKGCASSPHDSERQQALRQAAEELRNATNAAAQNALKKKLVKKLENAAKQVAATSTQTIAAAQAAAPSNRNYASQQQLVTHCKEVADTIPRLVQGVKASMADPDNSTARLNLINASQEMIMPCGKMITSARAAVPTVSDPAAALHLNNSSKQMSSALTELRTAVVRAQEACGPLEIDNALEMIHYLDNELAEFKKAVDALDLLPLPGETLELSSLQVAATSKTLGSAMAQLLTAAAQGNESYTGIAAQDTANALKALTNAVRGVAANSKDQEVQHRIIDSARDVVDKSGNLLQEAKKAMQNPGNPDNQQRLAQVAKAVSLALNNCVNCLPGQRDVDEAIKNITMSSQILASGQFPRSSRPFGETQANFNTAAVNLNLAANELVASVKGTPQQLATSAFTYSKAFQHLLDEGLEMAGQSSESEFRSQMISNLRNVSVVSSKLLLTAKSTAADPNAPNAKNQLAAAARALTESINQMINLCTSSAPGQKECDSALRNIQMTRNLLDNPNEPVNDMSYYECLDSVMEKSKNLGDGMSGIANYAKKSEVDPFGDSVRAVADAICGLIEAAAQAAYLVGVSDPSSIHGRPGLVDQSQFARANQAIQQACQNLTNPSSSQKQVLTAATEIAKHTSSLCNSCRLASAKTTNPVAKRHFVQSAKDVANATANLVKCIKVLDSEPSPHNQQMCAAAAKPLIESVENLTTFASSPEFASIPAKISPQARVGQEPITAAGKSIIDGSCNMITSAKSLILNPKDPPSWQSLANHSKNVSDSIKRLVSSIREKAPGQKECDEAINLLNSCIKELDQASLAAISQNLAPRNDNTLQGFHERLGNSTNAILDSIDGVRNTAKNEAERLGHEVSKLISFFEPLMDSAIGSASKTMNSKRQMALLDQTKTVTESALQLIYVSKETGGNPKAQHLHREVDEAAEAMQEAVHELMQTLEAAQTEAGVVTGMVDTITKAIVKMDETLPASEDSFVDYQTRMVIAAKEINKTAQDMLTRSTINVNDLGPLAAYLSHSYAQLASDSRGAQAATSIAEVANRIRSSVQDLGNACIELVKSAGALQTNPGDSYTQKELANYTRSVSEKVSFVLAALQAGSRGTQACINAASTVSGIIGDLDTTIMFATAGTLHAENENETFSDHRENILKTAKALVEDTKTLVAGAASSQEQLAVAAQNAVHTITQLADVVKFGAASLGAGNPDAQVLLINAVKDVASALGDLIQATKNASGKNIHDPAMMYLKESAKVMVTNVTSLLKTVKTVEDEHARGTRALESTIEAIAQEVRAYDAVEAPNKKATPEELIRSTKSVTIATAKAVAAGNSCKQEDAIVAANMGRKAICDLLVICKAAAQSAESKDLRIRTIEVGRDCAINYRELLQLVHSILVKPTSEGKQGLTPASRKIANSVSDIVATAEAIKDSMPDTIENAFIYGSTQSYRQQVQYVSSYKHFRQQQTYFEDSLSPGSDWVDPEDPTVIAENELLGAAASIDAAAKKLAHLKPRRSISKERDENLPFDEMILDAAKSITAATAALVRAASAAQRELVVEGKVGARPLYTSDDGQWSEGLISAAKMVAAATHSLCEAANSLVQGHATEEKLISSAKQVASSTAQLLVACKVKADPDSQAMLRLQVAGNAVKRATDNLVRAAQQAIDADDERNVVINRRMVGGIAQEIMAHEEILRRERELEEARSRLIAIRKAKYGERSDDEYQGYGSSFSGYASGYGSS